MAIVSTVPLASKSCLHKSLISSTHKLKPFCRTIPTLGKSRPGKSVMPSMNMSSPVSDDGVQRRTGGYHSNLWNDDIMHFLSTPYGVIRFTFLLLHNPSSFTIYTVTTFSYKFPYSLEYFPPIYRI
jgi:hypothetical protein